LFGLAYPSILSVLMLLINILLQRRRVGILQIKVGGRARRT
jgi:hypothetical protein